MPINPALTFVLTFIVRFLLFQVDNRPITMGAGSSAPMPTLISGRLEKRPFDWLVICAYAVRHVSDETWRTAYEVDYLLVKLSPALTFDLIFISSSPVQKMIELQRRAPRHRLRSRRSSPLSM